LFQRSYSSISGMLTKFEGIVLHSFRYTDNSKIAKIFTKEFGLISVLARGMGGRKSGLQPAIFQPPALIEGIIMRKAAGGIHTLREARINHPYYRIPFDSIKGPLSTFMSELLQKSIREEDSHDNLFRFFRETCLELDRIPVVPADFHIRYMVRLADLLGFAPTNNYSATDCRFDLEAGKFKNTAQTDSQGKLFGNRQSEILHLLLLNQQVNLEPGEAQPFVAGMIQYFQSHLPGIGDILSHEILAEIWD
jgi:DNA repair protein RecO (recombination protein O)